MIDPTIGRNQLDFWKGKHMAKKSGKGSVWDEVPEPSEELPCGLYDFEIAQVKVIQTTKEPARKMMVVELKVVNTDKDHRELIGCGHTEFFVLGTEEDPDAEEPATLKRARGGGVAFKAMASAAGVGLTDDDDDNCDTLKGETVSGLVEPGRGENPRKGIKETGWYKVGEQDPEVTEASDKKSSKRKAAPVAEKAPAKRKPRDDDDTEDEEEEPAPKKKSKTKPEPEPEEEEEEDEEEERPKRGKPKARAKDDDDEEEEEEEETERPKRGSRR